MPERMPVELTPLEQEHLDKRIARIRRRGEEVEIIEGPYRAAPRLSAIQYGPSPKRVRVQRGDRQEGWYSYGAEWTKA